MKNEENVFSLSKQSNYYSKCSADYKCIIESYAKLINCYVSYSIENMNIKDKDIFFTGLNSMQHIFRLMLFYTKNLELTFYVTQQSIYYYVEYISQITDREDNIFFNLSIKDAVIYIYTRSIFEIRKQYVKPTTEQEIFNNLSLFSHNYSSFIKKYSLHLFDKDKETNVELLDNILKKFMLIDYHKLDILKTCDLKQPEDAIIFLDSQVSDGTST